jgi:hypothetical protein
MTKKNLEVPKIGNRNNLICFLGYLLHWLLIALAFFCLLESFYPNENKIYVGLILPSAAVIGIVSLVSPGGIGVREGALVFLMISMGYSEESAIAISIVSRIWFLAGEGAFFLIGFTLNRV